MPDANEARNTESAAQRHDISTAWDAVKTEVLEFGFGAAGSTGVAAIAVVCGAMGIKHSYPPEIVTAIGMGAYAVYQAAGSVRSYVRAVNKLSNIHMPN